MEKSHLINVLQERGINRLYHANTLPTSLLYLKKRALLSRAYVEKRGLYQTPQWTDQSDKKLHVWNDIFLDTVDIHERASNSNQYGPVLFALDWKILRLRSVNRVEVTKCNPYKWEKMEKKDRWFTSKKDLEKNLDIGNFGQSIVVRFSGRLPFGHYLEEIILDDPWVETAEGVCFYARARKMINGELSRSKLAVPVRKRKCTEMCECLKSYQAWGCAEANRVFLQPENS